MVDIIDLINNNWMYYLAILIVAEVWYGFWLRKCSCDINEIKKNAYWLYHLFFCFLGAGMLIGLVYKFNTDLILRADVLALANVLVVVAYIVGSLFVFFGLNYIWAIMIVKNKPVKVEVIVPKIKRRRGRPRKE